MQSVRETRAVERVVVACRHSIQKSVYGGYSPRVDPGVMRDVVRESDHDLAAPLCEWFRALECLVYRAGR